MVLFGGWNGLSSGSYNLGDTWTWDGSFWTQWYVSQSPAPRQGAVLVYDKAREEVVLFGGDGLSGRLDDTWVWDGQSWSEKAPPASPPATDFAAATYDPESQMVLVYAPSGLWGWNGETWALVAPQVTPERSETAIAADLQRSKVVLFGGGARGGPPLYNDTWEYRGAPSLGFTWPIDPVNTSMGHDGACKDWPGLLQGCFWIADSSEDTKSVWRDVQPFLRNLNTEYGYHLGADYNLGHGNADRGKPVYPVYPGSVVSVRENVCGWGNIVFVRHDTETGTMTSMYAHVDWLPTGPPVLGQAVTPALPIAVVGNGQWNCGPKSKGKYPYHLHLEIRQGLSVDPGSGYSPSQVAPGPQGQVDPNAYIREH